MDSAIILISGLSATISSGSSDYLTAVTILLRDIVYIVTGKMPAKKKMVLYSRLALVFTLFIALVATLVQQEFWIISRTLYQQS
ncbi:sodium-solute symporter [Bacillus sp. JCM 19046]|nr:sodium-solute symporter [Bacillus sp. JCM 19046]